MKMRARFIQPIAIVLIVGVLVACNAQPLRTTPSQPTTMPSPTTLSSPRPVSSPIARQEPTATPLPQPTPTELLPTPTQPLPRPSPQLSPTPVPPMPTATPTATATPLHPLSIVAMRKRAYPGSDLVIEQTLAPGSSYSRYIASYRSEGLKIYALLTVPNGEKPATGWPVIIFNHGYIPPTQYQTTERYVAYVDAGSLRHTRLHGGRFECRRNNEEV